MPHRASTAAPGALPSAAMLRALLIDAAGTLIEPAEPVARTYSRILADFGHQLPPEQLASRFAAAFREAGEPDYSAHAAGDHAERAWWLGVVGRTVDPAGRTVLAEGSFDALFEHYARGRAWRVLPGVEAALAEATAAGLVLAVVSNFDLRLHRILAALGLDGWFEVVVTSAEARARKPDPAIFRLALDRLGVAPAAACHLGDDPIADIAGAQGLGIAAIPVGGGHGGLAEAIAATLRRGN